MTAFRVMFLKELRSTYRNPMAFGLLLLMPFLLMALISKAFEPLFEGRQSFDVPLVDLDATTESQALTASLDALTGIDIVALDWDRPGLTPADADEILDDEDYFTLIVIPDGFAQSLARGEDVRLSLYSDPAQEAYSGIVRDEVAGQLRVEDLMRAFESALAAETSEADAARIVESEIAPRVDDPGLAVERLFTEKRKATPGNFEQTVPGFALMFTFWLSLFIAASIHAEKREYHTWRRTLVAPVPRVTIMGSRVAAYVVLGMTQMTLLFVLGWALFGLNLGDHPYALLLVFFAMTLVTTGFGILMTALIRDFATLTSLMNLFVIVAAAAGGTLVPLFLLPDWLRTVSPVVPHYWAMDASQGVILLGDGVLDVLPAVGALLAFAAAFFALGLWRFRYVD
jgi:ABC-2 type transport system permease protein